MILSSNVTMEKLQSLTKVLLLEDDPTICLLFSGLLQKQGMEVTSFAEIKSALEYIESNPFLSESVILTDLQLPDGNGLEFVREIRKINKSIPIIVITSTEDPKSIIEVMREHVQEYIIKPVIPAELLSRIKYQLSNKDKEYQYSEYEKQKIISLEKLLDWYSYKNHSLKKGEFNTQDMHKNLFYGLRTSLAQGAGFGILTQIIDIIKVMPKAENGNYILDSEVLNLLEENAVYAKKVLDRFTEIEEVIFDRIPAVQTNPVQVLKELNSVKSEMSPIFLLKNQSFVMGEIDTKNFESNPILWNQKYFHNVFYELLLNAMRFSASSSKIYSLFQSNKDGLVISIVNSLSEDFQMRDGIPNEYLELVFEPFFRLHKNIYEKHGSLDFGIGLSFVRQTLQKFGGTISAFNIFDHTNSNKEPKIEFRIFLPYSSSEK